jgi:hypothetical protein
MTDTPPKPKRSIRSWWFVEMWSADGKFNGTVLAMMVLAAMLILPFVVILLVQ